MSTSSLFARQALASGTPELCATRALTSILENSPAARQALQEFAASLGAALPAVQHYEDQVPSRGGKGGVPDIAGFDARGERVLLLEGKFSAALTDHQPLSYLHSLPHQEAGLLLFIVPTSRVPALWNELHRRCEAQESGSLVPDPSLLEQRLVRSGRYRAHHTLALTSWRDLLQALHLAVVAAGDAATASDILQLQGLCQILDARAFRPLRAEDLAPEHGLRLHQLGQLVNRVCEELEAGNPPWLGDIGPFVGEAGEFGRDLGLADYDCWLGVSGQLWSDYRPSSSLSTPLWLEFYGDRSEIRRLQRWLSVLPQSGECLRALYTPNNGHSLAIPLPLPPGVEEHQVIRQVSRQVADIAALLAAHRVAGQSVSGDIVEEEPPEAPRPEGGATRLDYTSTASPPGVFPPRQSGHFVR